MSKIFGFFKHIPRPFLLSILSGLFIGTSYIPFSGWFLLICYAPLWVATTQLISENARYKKIFLAGWITQFILTLIGFNWIFHVASEFGQFHWFACLVALLAFAAFMHLYIPVSLLLASFVIRKLKIQNSLVVYLILALFLALLERIWPSIFEWNLGYVLLWIKLPIYQWADTVGFWGLSTFILIFQAIITWALVNWKTQKDRSLITIISVLLTISIFTGLGALKQKYWSKTDQVVQFGLVQGNIGNVDKILSEKADRFHTHILGIHTDLTEQHLKTHAQQNGEYR